MRVVVVGGGISGLASAALLAREGHEVELLERHDAVGGRAGSWERDGFRFDTGPSWYLMPEVFDHFFALMGTSTADVLDLVAPEPAYRVFFEGHDGPFDVARSRAANVAAFEAVEPGAGARWSATWTRRATRTTWRCGTSSTRRSRPGGPSRPGRS